MRYLLDTNILIAALKQNEAVLARMELVAVSDLILSPVVLGELETGVQKSRWQEQNRFRLDTVIAELPQEPLNAGTSVEYGRLRAALEKGGVPIGANDLWIAAQALQLGAILVTDNLGEFSRVTGLVIENWLRG
ncbi:MAG: twitching motility protein PilT [Deltaproteobacteria bacterium RIFOXYD12_FULL_56_24]|nr:MAG: twitching motility protein PilT [Deltaproteobacteria bacterium RIFOXYD12_FULL_56_24]